MSIANAAHCSMMGGKKAPTAKDYIQSGLPLLWDGIENSGALIHSNSSLTWVNLGSLGQSYNATRSQGVFIADGAQFSHPLGTSAGDARQIFVVPGYILRDIMAAAWTVEVVFTPSSGWFQNYSGIIGNHGKNRGLVFGQYEGGSLSFCVYQPLVRYALVKSSDFQLCETHTVSMVASNTASVKGKIFIDGTLANSIYSGNVSLNYNENPYLAIGAAVHHSSYTTSDRLFDGAINCVRIYSRDIADAEVAANHAIDKIRFGLP